MQRAAAGAAKKNEQERELPARMGSWQERAAGKTK